MRTKKIPSLLQASIFFQMRLQFRLVFKTETVFIKYFDTQGSDQLIGLQVLRAPKQR